MANLDILLLKYFYESLHLCLVCLSLEEQVPLVAGACEVMLGILALPVVVAREVVPEEAHALHVCCLLYTSDAADEYACV